MGGGDYLEVIELQTEHSACVLVECPNTKLIGSRTRVQSGLEVPHFDTPKIPKKINYDIKYRDNKSTSALFGRSSARHPLPLLVSAGDAYVDKMLLSEPSYLRMSLRYFGYPSKD